MNTTPPRNDDDFADTPPSDDLRAGEYVLGVLDATTRRAVQARIASDPVFAARVEDWERHFSAWLGRVDAATPSQHVWAGIRRRLGWPAVQSIKPGVWNNVSFWRGAAALAAAAGIAAVAFGLHQANLPGPPSPPLASEEQAARPVTVLARDDGSTGWIASLDARSGRLVIVPVPSALDSSGRVNELWIIPAGGAPLSLGMVSHDKTHSIAVPEALRAAIVSGSLLAVTLEPQSGIPHAQPTGPIVAKGQIQAI